MRQTCRFSILVATVAVLVTSCSQPSSVEPESGTTAIVGNAAAVRGDLLRVAVVTGGHEFDVPNFYRLFRELPGVDAYPQHIEHFASSPEDVRDAYDGQGRVLLSVDHQDAMAQVAWAREQGESRIFCLTLGHDNQSWSNPAFRRLLRQAIAWTAE